MNVLSIESMLVAVFCFVGTVFLVCTFANPFVRSFQLYLYIMCEYQRVPGVEDQHTAGMGCLYASILGFIDLLFTRHFVPCTGSHFPCQLLVAEVCLSHHQQILFRRRSIVVPHDSMESRYRRTTFLLNTANASEQYQKSKTTLTRREIIAKQNELAENKIPLVPADHLS